jgi:UDP-galactose transporter B1
MARTKQATPIKREPSSEYIPPGPRGLLQRKQDPNSAWDLTANSAVKESDSKKAHPQNPPGLFDLIICVSGIYAAL